jgi:hypothetical protein
MKLLVKRLDISVAQIENPLRRALIIGRAARWGEHHIHLNHYAAAELPEARKGTRVDRKA